MERQVLDLTAAEYPASIEALRRQIDTAQVLGFNNNGAGFYSHLVVAIEAPPLAMESPLAGARGHVLGIRHGMGFIVFLQDGRLSVIEGFCYGETSSADIDFSSVVFRAMPWRSTPDVEA